MLAEDVTLCQGLTEAVDIIEFGHIHVSMAMDAVGVALLRRWGTTPEVSQGPIFQQEQIARAVELGLGVSSPEEIELVTDDEESEAYAAEIRAILD